MDQRLYGACGGHSFERHDSVSQNTNGQPATTSAAETCLPGTTSAGAFHSTTHNPRRIRATYPATTTPATPRELRLPWFL
ncbi:hypothetical protein QP572_03055 [Brevibacterium sp. UMB10442]|nr:hypothetical protein [Brevibacterium sp. UMB10442]